MGLQEGLRVGSPMVRVGSPMGEIGEDMGGRKQGMLMTGRWLVVDGRWLVVVCHKSITRFSASFTQSGKRRCCVFIIIHTSGKGEERGGGRKE